MGDEFDTGIDTSDNSGTFETDTTSSLDFSSDISSDLSSDTASNDFSFDTSSDTSDSTFTDISEDVSFDTNFESTDITPTDIAEDTGADTFSSEMPFETTEDYGDLNDSMEPVTDIQEDIETSTDFSDADIFNANEDYEDLDESEAPVKVLKRGGGDTGISHHDYEQELNELDEGITNAQQTYIDIANETAQECDSIAEAENLSYEEKKAMLEEKKQQLLNLNEHWQQESGEWFEERDTLQEKVYMDQTADRGEFPDISEDVYDDAAENHANEVMEYIPEDTETTSTDFSDDSPSSKLNDSELFEDNNEGDYNYTETDYGKHAFGQLELEKGERNAYAQRTVGGDDRQEFDDGGHLIGNRFDGDGGYENLDAQARDLNRGEYKKMENEWANSLENGEKVYVDVNTYKSNGSDRPDAYIGYSITENDTGNRTLDAFSFQNASNEVQEEWDKIVADTDVSDNYSNAMSYTDEQKKLIE